MSGKYIGMSGVAAEVISSISGGNENVEFKPVNDFAISLVKNKLNKEYADNAEGFTR